MCNGNILRLLGLWGMATLSLQADVVVVCDNPATGEVRITGDVTEADRSFSPASTFKLIIALAAFEQGVATPATAAECRDPYLPVRPVRLAFPEAMRRSSNDFFLPVLAQLRPEQLMEMAGRCGFGQAREKSIPPVEEFRHGGVFRITPREQNRFMQKLAADSLPVDGRVRQDLLTVAAWPAPPQEGLAVYGKTGSWEQVYWFTGMRVLNGQTRVITVLLTKPGSTREQAIAEFMKQADGKPPGA